VFAPRINVSTESMNPITLALNALVSVSEKGSPDTKLSPPSSSAAMLSTVTHRWTMSFRMLPIFRLSSRW
jgi:hypothetical protein